MNRPVPGLEGLCEASEDGRIFSIARSAKRKDGRAYKIAQRELSQKTMRNGYQAVAFWINESRKMFLVHRLVLMSVSAPDGNRPFVNHKNGNKSDNRAANLEWCSRSENAIHAFRELGARRGGAGRLAEANARAQRIRGIDASGFAIEFPALMDAQRKGYRAACISECLAGTQKTHRGLRWERA